jgi:hypothetical protein
MYDYSGRATTRYWAWESDKGIRISIGQIQDEKGNWDIGHVMVYDPKDLDNGHYRNERLPAEECEMIRNDPETYLTLCLI